MDQEICSLCIVKGVENEQTSHIQLHKNSAKQVFYFKRDDHDNDDDDKDGCYNMSVRQPIS